MKISEINEGFWDVAAGFMNPNSKKNLTNRPEINPATGKRKSVDDYEAEYRQQYLDQAKQVEQGLLDPAKISDAAKQGMNQTRIAAGQKPMDWEHAAITTNRVDPRTLTPDQQAAINAKRATGGHDPIDWANQAKQYRDSRLLTHADKINSLQVDPSKVSTTNRNDINSLRIAKGLPPIDWTEREHAYIAHTQTP